LIRRYAKRDEICRDFAHQVLRQCAGATLGETLEFEQVFGNVAHLNLSVGYALSLHLGRLGTKPDDVRKVSVNRLPL
jgi:hypothetical protein